MDATLHPIAGRSRREELEPARHDHFSLGPGAAVRADMVLEPGWTLYSFDLKGRQALFVDIGATADLAEAPFAAPRQFDLARRAMRVPFAALPAVAAATPQPARRIFIFNIGRCGTTLVSAMLNAVEGLWSLSEPDAYFDVTMERAAIPEAEQAWLIDLATRLSYRPPPGRSAPVFAVKHRSQCLFQAGLFHRAFPDAAYVFLYRDAEGWTKSFYQFMRRLGLPETLDPETRRFVWWIMTANSPSAVAEGLIDLGSPDVGPEAILAVAWMLHVEAYRGQLAAGIPYLAIRYDELERDRAAITRRLLAHCGLADRGLDAALAAFDRDSQEGTPIARSQARFTLSDDRLATFRRTIDRRPEFLGGRIVLPDSSGATRHTAEPEERG